VAQRLNIVETLAGRGVFVRMMMMPVLREYELQTVGTEREVVFAEVATGKRCPGRKSSGRVDGNFGAGEVAVELYDGTQWAPALPGQKWEPVVRKDWSNIAQAQANWTAYGASAYKQKDLNYFHVDDSSKRTPKTARPNRKRSRSEDPTCEVLVRSGETVRDAAGNDKLVAVKALHLPRRKCRRAAAPHRRSIVAKWISGTRCTRLSTGSTAFDAAERRGNLRNTMKVITWARSGQSPTRRPACIT